MKQLRDIVPLVEAKKEKDGIFKTILNSIIGHPGVRKVSRPTVKRLIKTPKPKVISGV